MAMEGITSYRRVSEVLVPKRIWKQTSEGTSREGTCDEPSRGKGMISAKEVRLKELAFGGRQKGHWLEQQQSSR